MKRTDMNKNWIAAGILGIVLGNCCNAYAQETLGSGMSLDDLQGGAKKRNALVESARIKTIVVSPATAPTPLLKYRLWPSTTELKPGSAYVNMSRAIGMFQSVPEKNLREWRVFQIANEEKEWKAIVVAEHLKPFESILQELEIMALREDFTWDQRIRDLRGRALFEHDLSEVDKARELQKIIRWRSVERVKRNDFKGAVQTWKSGFRLARLVGSGELLVQSMVATGMERTIQEGILDAIQEPGCPNLYWALATVPHSQEPMQRSIQLEHANLERMFPIFDDTQV